MRLTMQEKRSLTDVTGPRYRTARKAEKTVILNEFCKSTGYNRKYAIGLLKHAGKTQTRRLGGKTVKVKMTARTGRKRQTVPLGRYDRASCGSLAGGYPGFICHNAFKKGLAGRPLV
ncbi:MAG: hypothetical protein LBR23_03425 [Spirochaetaceae bacterium]|nr:hypothetical protein [Spirochaetaceae bacterium]